VSETVPAHRRAVSPETSTALVLFTVAALVLLLRGHRFLQAQKLHQWSTVFSAVVLQALPFLVLGVVISGLVAAFVPTQAITRLLPRRALLSVPVAAVSAAALPGCECSSVPVAARLIDKGAPEPAAFAFLLAAPAINPVVTVATVVAFPGHPAMAVARVLASLLAAVIVGWCWTRIRQPLRHRMAVEMQPRGWRQRGDVTLATAAGDFLHAGGYLVIGAALAASLQALIPRSVLNALPGSGMLAVLVMAALAVGLAVCSEADAFIAASLTHFSLSARLAFLVVGPMLDVKLIALQSGTFGRKFVVRFAPLVLCVAVGSASLIGSILL
jgi:uncharacterized protein